MTTSNAGKALPIILAAITIVTALFFWKQSEVLRDKTQELLSQSSKQTTTKFPEQTPTLSPTPTYTPIPTPISQTNEAKVSNLTNKTNALTQKTLASARTTTTIVCTPVYGMANACAEHAVVDTAMDTTVFYNLAGLSYFTGLAAFIKSKKRA